MCGIAGYIGKEKISLKSIKSVMRTMINRGPDYQDYFHKQYENLNIYMVHSRLSIIDLNERSNQPMIYKDHVIIFNGEIYNYVELKKILENRNYQFKTNSDTEVLIKLYDCFGDDFYKYLEGMWSFAIFNLKEKKLILSRDRFGEKPLYYLKTSNGVYFGSETRFIEDLSLLKQGVNRNKILDYLSYGYNSVFLDNKTFKKNILSINPSTYFIIDSNLNFKIKKYWSIRKIKQTSENEKEIINNLSQLLQNALKIRLRSDVKNIFCLSGGIDSGSLVSISAKVFNLNVDTFSIIDSKSKKYNEQKLIEFTLNDTKANKNFLFTEKINLFDNLDKIVEYHNSPVLTVNYLLHSLMQKKISEMGYKVVLSGNGADEIYSGYYDHYLYHLSDLKKYYSKKEFKVNLDLWKKHITPMIRNKDYKNFGQYFKSNKKITLLKDYNNIIKRNRDLSSKEINTFNSELKNKLISQIPERLYPILYMDDLNSMMNSIENRTPFLDTKLTEYLFSIPSNLFIQKGYSKYLLRKSMQNILNDKIRNMRRKYGFNASLSSFNDINKKKYTEYIHDNINKLKDYVNQNELNSLLKNLDFNDMTDKENKFLFRLVSVCSFIKL
tara:strand:+ start:12717 stop:14543 length:1827 start_codon:yes stop_codon:yes gene_type:complete